MINAKQKALELFYKYGLSEMSYKKLVEFLCDEIISFLNETEKQETGVIFGGSGQDYWEQVKEEINKI